MAERTQDEAQSGMSFEELHNQHQSKVADTWSAYLQEYDRILKPRRDEPLSLLEIGIQNGGCLELWAQYLPRAKQIVGCDINPDCRQLTFSDPRVVVVVGDANSDEVERAITAIAPAFDVVIDDGSHRSSDIVKSFARYFPLLRDGGLFVIEDLHCSYWQEFEGGLFHPHSAMTYLKRLADVVNHEHWGVPRQRGELLASISEHYGVQLSEQELSRIHSVEFSNSMCVVHKAPPEANELGPRSIVGREALVCDSVLALDGQRNTDLTPQTGNAWSTAAAPPEEEVSQLHYLVEERARELAELSRTLISAQATADERATALADMSRSLIEARAVAEERAQQISTLLHDIEALKTALSERDKQLERSASELAQARHECTQMAGTILELKQHSGVPSSRPEPVTVVEREPVSVSPLVTVVIPSYNHRRFIFAAVDSVLGQTHPNLELIILDDGSTDDSVDQLRARYGADPRVTLIARENRGAHQTINEAIGRGRGEFVTVLNSDDVYEPGRLARMIEVARERGGHPFFGISGLRVVDEAGQPSLPNGPLKYYASVLEKFQGEPDPAAFWVGNLAMTTSNFFFSRSVFEQVGGFSPLRYTHDWDWGLRAAERFKLVRVDEVLLHYRVHGSNTISEGNFWKHVAENAYVFASAMRREGLSRMADLAGLKSTDVMRSLLQNESFAPIPTLFLLSHGMDEESMMSLLRSGALESSLAEVGAGSPDLMLSAEHLRLKLKAKPQPQAKPKPKALAPAPAPKQSWAFRLRKAGARWRRRLTGDPL
jgi:glycosyltransferase involved in cell wall biosynthesis